MRTDGQTNRHDETNSRISQFCEKAPKRVHVFWDITACRAVKSRKQSDWA